MTDAQYPPNIQYLVLICMHFAKFFSAIQANFHSIPLCHAGRPQTICFDIHLGIWLKEPVDTLG